MSSSSEKSGVRSSGEEGGADVSERGEAMRRDRLEVSEAPRAALRLPLPGTEGLGLNRHKGNYKRLCLLTVLTNLN